MHDKRSLLDHTSSKTCRILVEAVNQTYRMEQKQVLLFGNLVTTTQLTRRAAPIAWDQVEMIVNSMVGAQRLRGEALLAAVRAQYENEDTAHASSENAKSFKKYFDGSGNAHLNGAKNYLAENCHSKTSSVIDEVVVSGAHLSGARLTTWEAAATSLASELPAGSSETLEQASTMFKNIVRTPPDTVPAYVYYWSPPVTANVSALVKLAPGAVPQLNRWAAAQRASNKAELVADVQEVGRRDTIP